VGGGGTGEAAAAGDEGRQAAGGEGGRLGEQFCRSDCWNRGRRSDGFFVEGGSVMCNSAFLAVTLLLGTAPRNPPHLPEKNPPRPHAQAHLDQLS
jgi:hypothetical protein